MKTLFILNDPPYGTERNYNGLRLVSALSKREGQELKLFLIGDAAACVMLKNIARNKAEIGVCGTCMDARGILPEELAEGTARSTLEQLTDWTIWADKVIAF